MVVKKESLPERPNHPPIVRLYSNPSRAAIIIFNEPRGKVLQPIELKIERYTKVCTVNDAVDNYGAGEDLPAALADYECLAIDLLWDLSQKSNNLSPFLERNLAFLRTHIALTFEEEIEF